MRTALLSSLAVVGLGVAAAGATTTAKAGDLGVRIGLEAPVVVVPERVYPPPRVVGYYDQPAYYYGPRYYRDHDSRWEHRRWEERRWHERHEAYERHHDGFRHHWDGRR